MTRLLLPGLILTTGLSGAWAGQVNAESVMVLASKASAALDSDLMKGGGTDDTTALQRALDRGKDGRAVHLIIDGPALVSGLEVYSHTTIECTAGEGLYLKDNSRRAIIRNKHRSRDAILEERITVRGCFLNGNRVGQFLPGVTDYRTRKEPDQSWICGLQFHGVNDLAVEGVTLWNVTAFGALISNANRITIRNVIVDHGADPDVDITYSNTDGLHFKGPLQYLTVDGVKLRTGDDALAFNADDWVTDDLTINNEDGPYVRSGPITDVLVSNVHFMDAVQAFRFSSSRQRIDRVIVSNVTGTLRGNWLANITHFVGPSPGNIGSISFSNVNVDQAGKDAKISAEFAEAVRKSKDRTDKWKGLYGELNGGRFPLININAHAENVQLENVTTRVANDRPIIRIGPNARVQNLTVALKLHDPQIQAVPLALDQGGRIQRLKLSVDWMGNGVEVRKNPIQYNGGTIEQLQWLSTPPDEVRPRGR